MSAAPITALFVSRYSVARSLLTLDEPGKAKPGNAPSVFDLAKDLNLDTVHLVDDSISGLIQAYKSAKTAGVKLVYGIRLTVCSDLTDKRPESRLTESKVIIFMTGSVESRQDLVKIWSRAWTKGHFNYRDDSYGRIDWSTLKALWSPRLMLALPFFSSFIAENTLTMKSVVPDLSFLARPETAPLWVFREVASQLPFAPLIDTAIDRFAADLGGVTAIVVPSKTILYPTRASFKAYVVARARDNRKPFDAPEVAHLSSDAFCAESYRELTGAPLVDRPT